MLINLNPQQLKAVNTLNGNLLIVASAGTGKTSTIVERYVNMVENHNIQPNEIMMTTFTNKAAKDMMEKIKSRTNKISSYIGTMHSLFFKIILEHSSMLFENNNITLIEDYERLKIIKQILIEEKIYNKADNCRYFSNWISRYKNAGVFADNLNITPDIDLNLKTSNEFLIEDEVLIIDPLLRSSVNKIYKMYEGVLKKRNLIDFDNMILLTLKLFENNPHIKDKYSLQFKSIMVDEAQDLNPVQMKILQLLKRNNLCLIGDDCQNIFTWRGSSNALVFNFNENENSVTLKENYRSTQNIIKSVNKVIDSLKHKISKELISTRTKGSNIKIEEFNSFNEETYFLIDNIKDLINKGEKKEEIVVLFRTNFIGQFIEREFRKNKIPCHFSKTLNFFKREEIKDILSFLKLKVNNKSVDDFDNVLSLIDGMGKVKIEVLKNLTLMKNIDIVDSLNYLDNIKLDPSLKEKLNFLKLNLIDFNKNPIDLFLNNLGYKSYLIKNYEHEKKRLEDKFENIEVLKNLFKDYTNSKESIKEFLYSLMDLDKKEKTAEKVILSTIHSAKGLEFKHVFLVQCNEGILPYYNQGKLEDIKKDEELRLFYVAISRAKDFLTISHSRFGNNFKEYEASQFLDIIK